MMHDHREFESCDEKNQQENDCQHGGYHRHRQQHPDCHNNGPWPVGVPARDPDSYAPSAPPPSDFTGAWRGPSPTQALRFGNHVYRSTGDLVPELIYARINDQYDPKKQARFPWTPGNYADGSVDNANADFNFHQHHYRPEHQCKSYHGDHKRNGIAVKTGASAQTNKDCDPNQPCYSVYNPWITHDMPLPTVNARSVSAKQSPPKQEVVVVGGGIWEPDVGAVSVRMLADAIVQDDDGVTCFAVDVFPEDGRAPWRVMHRYSHFESLASVVGTSVGTAFPAKHGLRSLFGAIPLEERRRGLERWLKDVIATHQRRHGTLGVGKLRDFLLLRRSACPNAVTQPQDARLPPVEEDHLVLLDVDLPRGTGYGSLLSLAVETEFGQTRNIAFAVPWGFTAGTPLELWYDPQEGTLGVHPCWACRSG